MMCADSNVLLAIMCQVRTGAVRTVLSWGAFVFYTILVLLEEIFVTSRPERNVSMPVREPIDASAVRDIMGPALGVDLGNDACQVNSWMHNQPTKQTRYAQIVQMALSQTWAFIVRRLFVHHAAQVCMTTMQMQQRYV